MRYRDLGPVEIERDGQPVRLPGKRLTAALSYLLVRSNRWVSVDALIEALWGQAASATRDDRGTLASHLWRLRALLEPDRERDQPYTTLVSDIRGYCLKVAADQADSMLFERLALEARDLSLGGQHRRARDRCDQALALWRGLPWSPHSDEVWAAPAVARLLEIRASVLEQRLSALVELGDVGYALADLETVLVEFPLRERLWALQMMAQVRAGRTDRALAAFANVRRLLVDELGIEPGPQLVDLHARILAGDPSLTTTSAPVDLKVFTTADAAPRLPVRRTAVVGREVDVSELVTMVSANSLVTVVGAAGCGKTTVAIEVAREVSDEYLDGVRLVDLTFASDRRDILNILASEFQLAPSAGRSIEETLKNYARSHRTLVVLDNCDHLLDDLAVVVDTLLVATGDLSVLATSRQPLNIDGELLWDLQPLSVLSPAQVNTATIAELRQQPAMQLFLARLNAATPRLRVETFELRTAALICAAVDGIPLAIELSAAQVRAHSLSEVLAQVRLDPGSLSRVGRGSTPHHASLRIAIDLSVRTMADFEVSTHQALAAIPGPFTTRAAVAMTGQAPATTAATLGQLVHRSMLTPLGPQRPEGPSRFAQLSTIRSHATTTDPARRELLEGRRDAFVSDLVESAPPIGARGEIAWMEQIDDDLAAVRATLQHSTIDRPSEVGMRLPTRLGMYWYYRGAIVEWERWARIAAQAATDPVTRCTASISHAGALTLMGRASALKPALDAAWDGLDQLPLHHQETVASYAFAFGNSAWTTRDASAVRKVAELTRRVAETTADRTIKLFADMERLALGVLTSSLQPDAAFRQADALWQRVRDEGNHYVGWAVATWASLVGLTSGDVDRGLTWSDRAFEQYDGLGVGGLSARLELRAGLHALRGEDERAVLIDHAGRVHAKQIGVPWPVMLEVRPLIHTSAARLHQTQRDRAQRDGALLSVSELLALPAQAVG